MLGAMNRIRTTLASRVLMTAAVGGALCVAAAGPAGAGTVGLLKVSQLPSGYKAATAPITISGSTIAKGVKSLGGGFGATTTGCKGTPGASSLKGYTAHIAAFGKGSSASSLGLLAEVVLETPSAAAAEKYFAAVKTATASCAGTQTVSMSGYKVKVTYKSRHTAIDKAGADSAIGTVVGLSAKSTIMGVTATVRGDLGVQTYRKGADIVEVIVDDFGVKADRSTGSATVTFSPGSSSLVTSVGKAAIRDL